MPQAIQLSDGSTNLYPLAYYPVGSIYLSTSNSVSPATLFGGTWVQIKDKFLLTAGDSYTAGATGGEAEHTLTVDEMPKHRHPLNASSTSSSTYLAGSKSAYSGPGLLSTSDDDGDQTFKYVVQKTGGGAAHNNMPPYLVVYAWYRSA